MQKKGNEHKEKHRFPSSIERWGEKKIFSGGLWPFNVFVMLKTTFSKHRLIKISITHVYIKPKLKKWYNSNGYSHKWTLYIVIRWKSLFHREGTILLIAEEVNLIRGVFLVVNKFLAVGWDSPPSLGFPISV